MPGPNDEPDKEADQSQKGQAYLLSVEIDCALAVEASIVNGLSEGRALLQEVIGAYAGGRYSILIALASSEIALSGNDVKTALDVLRNVESEDPYYPAARARLAEVYLV